MKLIVSVFVIASLVYFEIIILFRLGLKHQHKVVKAAEPFVSIVIAVKNEEKNLPNILEDLRRQDYPLEKWEVIIIDDGSTDRSLEILSEAQKRIPNLKVYQVKHGEGRLKFKKAALALGIQNARGEVILTTDADCRLRPGWVRSMAQYFDEKVGIVVGYSELVGENNLFQKWQTLDYLMLMTAAQGAINLGLAWGASGQNWGFRKSLYERVGGYSLIRDRIGGDDSVFMQLIKSRTRAKAVFASDKEAWVQSKAVADFSTFFRQRVRWAGEATYIRHFNFLLFGIVIAAFLTNLAPLVLGVAQLFDINVWASLVFIVIGKLICEYILAHKGAQIYNRRDLLRFFPMWFVTQIPYVMFLAFGSIWSNKVKWKNNGLS